MRTRDENGIKDIPDLVSNEVSKAISRKKIDVKDVVVARLGSPSLMSQIDMNMLENE